MQFSQEQEKALKQVAEWLKHGKSPIFRLFGYAGTGKTTLARHFAEHVDGGVQFAAYTGKAAQVLRANGASNAKTLHSLIYRVEQDDNALGDDAPYVGGPSFVLNPRSDISDVSLVVVDECSMVDEKLGKDLLSFGRPVLVLGDPAQLPPISGGGYFTDGKPDYLLTEVHRQAQDNPIIRLAMQAREGIPVSYGDYGAAKVIRRTEVDVQDVLRADQILIGTNRSRKSYNRRLRELKGFSDIYPQSGDKLVCLRNEPSRDLLNGSLWQVKTVQKVSSKPFLGALLNSEDDGAAVTKVKLLKSIFEASEQRVSWAIRRNYDEFDYGYALTVHKAQGSQWDSVMLFDESFAFKEYAKKWLYTGITRASKKLIIVR